MEEGRIMQSILLDFYGGVLTEKQRECYDLHYNEDLSLAEIAEQSGISRQGVWDNIRRAEKTLSEMEEKTGLVRRTDETRKCLTQLRDMLSEMASGSHKDVVELSEKAMQLIDRQLDKE